MNAYETILNMPTPTPEENTILIQKAVNGGDAEKWDLVLKNAKLVIGTIKRNIPHDEIVKDFDEIMASGIFGLYKGVKCLKLCAPKQFVTYVGAYIAREIVRDYKNRRSAFNMYYRQTPGIPVYLNGGSSEDFEMLQLDDRDQPSPFLYCDIKDSYYFSKKIFENILRGNILTACQKNIIRVILRNDCDMSIALEELNTSKQNVYAILAIIKQRIIRYLNSKFKKELKDIYGFKGRHHKWKFYDEEGRLISKHKYFTNDIDKLNHELAADNKKNNNKIYRRVNSYSKCNLNKRLSHADIKSKVQELLKDLENKDKKRNAEIQKLEHKLNSLKKTMENDRCTKTTNHSKKLSKNVDLV